MRKSVKITLCTALSFMFIFSCLGFATLTDTLSISGNAAATPPNAVFITDATVVNTNVSSESHEVVFPTNLQSNIRGARNNSVTYMITVKNNTSYKYAYSGIDYVTDAAYNGNSYIGNGITITTKDKQTDSSATFNSSDTLEPGAVRTFYVTYTVSRNTAANKDLNFLVNFKFGIHVDSAGDVAIDNALDKFTSVLNDSSAGGGYEVLTDKIDDKYDGRNDWKANYIGNVVDSSSSDSKIVNDLFGGELTLDIDGRETNVTVLIKREDVDGNPLTGDDYTITHSNGGSTSGYGCEMTLYMTTHHLQYGTPTVYAAVFTCQRNSDGSYGSWYVLGDIYEGTANIVGYEGGQSTGSFDTGTWRSVNKTYTVSSDYQYTVSQNNTIQTVIQAEDVYGLARNKLQPLLRKAKNILDGDYGVFAGVAIERLRSVYDEASIYYTIGADGTLTVNPTSTRAQLVPYIREVETALVPFDGVLNPNI
ncbi:MAG: hypothetical protein E7607_05900 [Ruminococcaceae bacterium]|nr:hypothetical protein [Oscillospiraceae bacterium]